GRTAARLRLAGVVAIVRDGRRGSGSRSPRTAAGGKSGLQRAGWPLTAALSDQGKVPQKGDGPVMNGESVKRSATIRGVGDGAARQTPPGARRTRGCVARAWPQVRRESRRATAGREE